VSGQGLVIGITGPNASGKGEVARMLRERGYGYCSLSDIVREEALRRGLTTGREHLILVGRDMRRAGGRGALAERVLGRLRPPCVVDSIRNPGEVAVLRGLPGFRLLGIDASPAVRFERLVARARPGDPRTVEEFLEKERIENSADPEGQQLAATFALSDRALRNDGALESLEAALDAVLRDWEAAG